MSNDSVDIPRVANREADRLMCRKGGHYSLVNNVLGGQNSLVDNVRGGGGGGTIFPSEYCPGGRPTL